MTWCLALYWGSTIRTFLIHAFDCTLLTLVIAICDEPRPPIATLQDDVIFFHVAPMEERERAHRSLNFHWISLLIAIDPSSVIYAIIPQHRDIAVLALSPRSHSDCDLRWAWTADRQFVRWCHILPHVTLWVVTHVTLFLARYDP